MGFQGSMIVNREASKDYIVLSTNQSKNLLSGGQMSCDKDAATFWPSTGKIDNESAAGRDGTQPSEIVFGKDMNEWIKEFVQNEFFRGSNDRGRIDVEVELKKTDVTEEVEGDEVETAADDSRDLEAEDDSIIDNQENEYDERQDDIDHSRLSINDESKSGKVKRNFKVFKFMKNAIKRHIKK